MPSVAAQHRSKAIETLRLLVGSVTSVELACNGRLVDEREALIELFVDEMLCAAKAWSEGGQ
jgi:hypothetical protein